GVLPAVGNGLPPRRAGFAAGRSDGDAGTGPAAAAEGSRAAVAAAAGSRGAPCLSGPAALRPEAARPPTGAAAPARSGSGAAVADSQARVPAALQGERFPDALGIQARHRP